MRSSGRKVCEDEEDWVGIRTVDKVKKMRWGWERDGDENEMGMGMRWG